MGASTKVTKEAFFAQLQALSEEMQAREPAPVIFGADILGLTFGEGEETVEIEVCRDGAWDHPKWGRIEIMPDTRASSVRNFEANVRLCGDLPLDYDHEAGLAGLGWRS